MGISTLPKGRNKMSFAISGIILAGGQSRRFGTPKAFAIKNEMPFYQYSINAVSSLAQSIVLVSNNEIVNEFKVNEPHITLITDHSKYQGLGPLAGIYSGMDSIDAEWYLVSPIDVPFIEESVYKILLQHIEVGKEAIVPIVKGRMQPLISVLHNSLKEKIKEQLEQNELSPKQLFAKSQVSYINMDDERPFRNINYKEDLRKFLQEESQQGGRTC
jgi:molybdenum cofactor guanylyltransferase